MQAIVRDRNCFYEGQTVDVKDVRSLTVGGEEVRIYWVAFGSIEFAVAEHKLELLGDV